MPTDFVENRFARLMCSAFVEVFFFFLLYLILFSNFIIVFDSADLVSPRIPILFFNPFCWLVFYKPPSITTSQHLERNGLSNICSCEYDTNKCLFLKIHTKHKKKEKKTHTQIPIAHTHML